MKVVKCILWPAFLTSIILLSISNNAFCRAKYDITEQGLHVGKVSDQAPYVDIGVHNKGRIGLTVVNQGQFGTGFLASLPGEAPSCIYPYPGTNQYLFAGAFWIGSVVGRDTLVSVGADGWQYIREMWPDPGDEPPPLGGAIVSRSISNPDDINAVSEQDFIAVYTDTVTNPTYAANDATDGRPHIPLNIEVTQRSYGWSYSYAADFILFDYSIKNIGRKTLNKVYMGIYVDADVKTANAQEGFDDDICGFKRAVESPQSTALCPWIDTINIAWIADNDGKQSEQDPCPYSASSLTAVTGTRVVRTPSDSLKYSFNWWISNGEAALDWGPRRADSTFRDFGGFLGTPEGDKNKYYIMRTEEFDYDQLFCALDHTSEGWFPPPSGSQARNFADGFDTRYLLSFGPFDIQPGEVLPISFAYVAGADFHQTKDCEAFKSFDPYYPEVYYETFNFDNLGKNAIWASWIYDNPGVDTDNDGYRGKYRICVLDSAINYDTTFYEGDSITVDTNTVYIRADTSYYEGDGVPDFRGASPPPPPELWVVDTTGDTLRSKVLPRVDEFTRGEFRVRWNGLRSETTKDIFSDLFDFEGYRVYLSNTPSAYGFSVIASYDIEDYNRYYWDKANERWDLPDIPFTRDSLEMLYGEGFEPLVYTIDHPLYINDSAFYFRQQDWNQSDLRDTTKIHKVYPDERPPTVLSIDSARIYYPEELTDDGLFFKYYEYEYYIRNLLPSQLYYIGVTAFDYGSPGSDLESLETPPNRNYVAEYPQNDNTTVESSGLHVVVYPNPYRADGKYKEDRFEGVDYIDNEGNYVQQAGLPNDRTRSIHFINLPHKCTIRIFTIDGDLVRQIEHDVPKDDPRSMHHRWDLITRNTQAVVSGIYYYSIESEYGNQIGKIVIIM
jgi:hypothetical protein